MTERYITLKLTADGEKPLFAVIDRRLLFNSEKKAIAERKRLNEVDDSINRAFELAKQDRKKHQ